MSNAILLLAIVAALALGGNFFLSRSDGQAGSDSEVRAKPDATHPSKSTTEKSIPPIEPNRPTLPPVSKARPLSVENMPPQEDGRTIEFQVVEGGLAVAYGDVILGKVDDGSSLKTGKKGRYEPPQSQLWEKPEIPYVINADVPNPARIEKAVDYFNQHTPVMFIPYANQADAIVFEKGEEHCYSALGKTGGLQPIRLSSGCQMQEILHEMMHALGFIHEQSRPDRDQYVQVLWENIEEKFQSQFALVPESLMEATRGTAFDFRSIMLYKPDTFALKPGLTTLEPRAGKPAIDPTQQGLSEGDLQRLKHMYRL